MANGVIKDVYFYYARIDQPINKYNSADKEYKVDVALDQASFTAFVKQFPKKAYKMVANADFYEKYKSEVPFPEQPIQYILKFAKDEVLKDGTPIAEEHKPKVYLEDNSGQVYNITSRFNVGNGSKGDLFHYIMETKDYGNHPKLNDIKVKHLIKYESNGGNLASTALELTDDVDLSGVISDGAAGTPAQPGATAAAATPKAAPKTTVRDDDIPF